MAYQQNKPQATDQLKNSQADILGNFQAIKTLVDVNHVTFDTPDQGKHKFVTFPEQGASPATAVNEVALFSRQSALTGVAELAVRKENNGAVVEFTSALAAANGWTRLPSGILLKWGNGNANGLTNIIFPAGANIPPFVTIFSMQITTAYINAGDAPNGFVRLNDFVAPWTQFSVFASPRTTSGALAVAFQYLAIGI